VRYTIITQRIDQRLTDMGLPDELIKNLWAKFASDNLVRQKNPLVLS
jgi:hypothetical protein